MNLEDILRLLASASTSSTQGTFANGAAPAASAGLLGALGGIPGIGIALLPTLLSLFHKDPAERNRQLAMMLSSPKHLLEVQQEVARRLGALPENVAARSNIVGQSTSLSNDLAHSLAARGLGTTGIAAVAQPVANSAVQGRLSNFEGSLSAGALSRAQEIVARQIAALNDNPYGQSQLQGGLDRSMSALLPAIGDYYKRRYQAPVARIA